MEKAMVTYHSDYPFKFKDYLISIFLSIFVSICASSAAQIRTVSETLLKKLTLNLLVLFVYFIKGIIQISFINKV